MTYLFKLARRMASALTSASVVALAACSEAAPRDFLGPDPTNPPPTSGPVSLHIAPKTGAIVANQPLQFRAWGRTASGDSIAVAASWTASGGQIGPDGVFTSAAGGSFTVQGFAIGKPHLSDAATVQVEAPLSVFSALYVSPNPAAVPMGGTIAFSASAPLATGGMTVPSVTWTATGGDISSTGVYSAGTAPGTFQVVASTMDGVFNDTVSVQVQAASLQVLAVSPKALTVSSGELVDFAVAGQWNDGSTSPPAVQWTSTAGSISATGRLTVGGTPGVFQVVAQHGPSGRADTALVTVMPAVARIEVTPGSVQLQPGAQKAFSAVAVRTDGVVIPVAVQWIVTGGTISASGVYSAGSILGGGYRVIIRYLGGVFADTAEVTIAAPAATLTGLSLTPGTVSVGSGAQLFFNAVPTWSDGSSALPALVWTATGGAVSGDGTWTAPVQAGSYQVMVRHPGSGLADTATVAVTEAPRVTAVAITQQTSSIQTGGTRQFTAQATWSDGASRPVEWLWSATGGTITVNGLFTAGNLAGQFMVIATCVGCSATDTTGVSVSSAPPPAATLTALALSPAQALLNPGDVLPLHVHASWSDGSTQVPDLTWTVGGGTRSGLNYTAGSTPGEYLLIARHAAGTLADTSMITIEGTGSSPTLTSLVLNPSSVTMNPGERRTLTVAATWSDGSTTLPPLKWAVAGGTLDGLTYTAGSTSGTFRVIARHDGGTLTDTMAVAVIANSDSLVSLALSPDSTTVPSGFSVSFSASGKTVSGATVTPQVTWSATGGTITSAGVYTASTASGTFRVVATCATCALADTAVVVIGSPTPPPPTGSVGDLVVYPNDEIAFIIGPQLKSGAASNPWPWFDQNMIAKGLEHGAAFPVTPSADPNGNDYYINRNYYDLGLALYTAYYRSGDARHLVNARKVADSWWQHAAIGSGTTPYESSFAPRNISLGGLMLRALDGRPEMWPWITQYAREMYQMWVGARQHYDGLYYGVRDGGYMLLYAAWLAKAHPDAAVRAEFRQKALDGATKYYARLQYADGSWRWEDDGIVGKFMQPFMVGLLLDGMVAVHRLTGDAQVRASILKSVDNLYADAYRKDGLVPGLTGVRWRGMWYFLYSQGCESGCGSTALDGGWDTNTLRETRQLNSTIVHAFGYAYQLTTDPKYLEWGDEVFSATYGKGQGPGADAYSGLADFREKEYNAAYRSSGRYLAWRLGF
ncbi:MAG: hypothetical protein ABR551_07525 [Gemmatimonadales bacterium]